MSDSEEITGVLGYSQGIPFSSPAEKQGTEPIDIAIRRVKEYVDEYSVDKTDYTIYIVWFAYIMGGWKALLSTTRADGSYFEVTYDKDREVEYVDRYIKAANITYKSGYYQEETK